MPFLISMFRVLHGRMAEGHEKAPGTDVYGLYTVLYSHCDLCILEVSRSIEPRI